MKLTRDLNLDLGLFTAVGVGARVGNHVTSAFQVDSRDQPGSIKYYCLND